MLSFRIPENTLCLGHLAYLLIVLSTTAFSVFIAGFVNHRALQRRLSQPSISAALNFPWYCDLLYGIGKTLTAA